MSNETLTNPYESIGELHNEGLNYVIENLNSMKTFYILSVLLLCFAPRNAWAQDEITSDPLLKYKVFLEEGITINSTKVNSNQSVFNTSSGTNTFNIKDVLPTADINFHIGFIFKNKKNKDISLNTIKTGLCLLNRNAQFTDSSKTNFRFSTSYLQIPIMYGIRRPLRHNTVKNNMYRAVETNFGFYTATPLFQNLINTDNPNNNKTEFTPFNYLRFGFLGEVLFTELNSKGNGHKIGIRATLDTEGMLKIKETPNQLYPSYFSLGLFYSLYNDYK